MKTNSQGGNGAEATVELDLYEIEDDEPQATPHMADMPELSEMPQAPQAPRRAPPAPPQGARRAGAAARQAPAEELDEELDEDGHRVVLIDGERFTVVEGDLVLDVDQKILWQDASDARQTEFVARATRLGADIGEAALNEYGTASSSLVGIVQAGKLVRWAPGTVLTYCVLQHTFPRQEWYEEAVANMAEATAAWEQVCGVKFEHVADLDTSSSVRPQGVLFPVRYIGAGGAFIAASFFPNDPTTRRRVLIDPSYFTTAFDHVGVLRHELGHVLGFRHEHIRSGAPAVCPHEDLTGTQDLTRYDPHSVMHYFCGGVGTRTLEITEVDRVGAQKLYGPPLADFELLQA